MITDNPHSLWEGSWCFLLQRERPTTTGSKMFLRLHESEKRRLMLSTALPRAGNLLCTKSTTLAAADKCFRNQFCSFLVYKMEWSSNFDCESFARRTFTTPKFGHLPPPKTEHLPGGQLPPLKIFSSFSGALFLAFSTYSSLRTSRMGRRRCLTRWPWSTSSRRCVTRWSWSTSRSFKKCNPLAVTMLSWGKMLHTMYVIQVRKVPNAGAVASGPVLFFSSGQ